MTAYRRVANALRGQIERGRLKPGDRIPSLTELQQAFGVSDTVILEARKVLVAEGLLLARAGDGTYVRERPRPKRVLRNLTDPAQAPFLLEEDDAELVPEVVEGPRTVTAAAEVARRLRIRAGERVLRLRQVFHYGETPVQQVTTHTVQAADATAGAPLWEDELTVRPAADAEARALHGVAGNLATVVTRTDFNESGAALRLVETVMLTDRFTVVYQQKQWHLSAE
ncbi:GntR family transcriptional regulator [Streptomyces sp. NPDC053499]|uniref:GntR family transcriptional regulator n=1 Tax=Streptomyces sp. NPDC053499 TaxID=3365707 RepID=UPI0037D534A7